jgi:hypothetical protein
VPEELALRSNQQQRKGSSSNIMFHELDNLRSLSRLRCFAKTVLTGYSMGAIFMLLREGMDLMCCQFL